MAVWLGNGNVRGCPRRTALLALGAALVLAAGLAACRTQPAAEAPRARLAEPPTAPTTAPSTAAPDATGEAPPPGMYFLHAPDDALAGCAFVGERTTGTPGRDEVEQRARARAVLDMAEQARWLGGNVVELPTFREDYEAGHLLGRVYRCAEHERRAIYRRAARERTLTVIAP